MVMAEALSAADRRGGGLRNPAFCILQVINYTGVYIMQNSKYYADGRKIKIKATVNEIKRGKEKGEICIKSRVNTLRGAGG